MPACADLLRAPPLLHLVFRPPPPHAPARRLRPAHKRTHTCTMIALREPVSTSLAAVMYRSCRSTFSSLLVASRSNRACAAGTAHTIHTARSQRLRATHARAPAAAAAARRAARGRPRPGGQPARPLLLPTATCCLPPPHLRHRLLKVIGLCPLLLHNLFAGCEHPCCVCNKGACSSSGCRAATSSTPGAVRMECGRAEVGEAQIGQTAARPARTKGGWLAD
jgi:hypothetical protein